MHVRSLSVPCAARLLRDSCKATCVRGLVSTKVLRTCEQILRATAPAQAPSQDVVICKHVDGAAVCRSRGGVSLAWRKLYHLYHLTRVGQTGPALHFRFF